MQTAACVTPAGILRTSFSTLWSRPVLRSRFGDAAVLLFLVAQCLDGVFTYVGVLTYGMAIEGNPILATLMRTLGYGPALIVAKSVASALGIALHLAGIHAVVALLTAFYMAAAVLPWATLLLGS